MNMELADKNIYVGSHPSEWFGVVFPVWTYRQIPDKFVSLQKFIQWSNRKRAGTGAGKEGCPIQTQTTSLWRNFNVCMWCISFKGLILIQM